MCYIIEGEIRKGSSNLIVLPHVVRLHARSFETSSLAGTLSLVFLPTRSPSLISRVFLFTVDNESLIVSSKFLQHKSWVLNKRCAVVVLGPKKNINRIIKLLARFEKLLAIEISWWKWFYESNNLAIASSQALNLPSVIPSVFIAKINGLSPMMQDGIRLSIFASVRKNP